MVDYAKLTLFLYIGARISGFVLFSPVFGRRSIPGIFRACLILMLTLFALSATDQTVEMPHTILGLSIHILLELGLGFVLGMVMSFFFYIPQLGGFEIDTQMGMTMNQTYDAGTQANVSVTGEILNILMTLLFFTANGHHTMLRIVLTSGEVVGFGEVALGQALANTMLELFIQCTLLAVKLCMPILAAELIGQLGMGILMKVIPQINVFSINIELKVLIGLTLLFLLMIPFGDFLLEAEMSMLDSIHTVLTMAA
jgi:flagellar biosynthetic protein FliR